MQSVTLDKGIAMPVASYGVFEIQDTIVTCT